MRLMMFSKHLSDLSIQEAGCTVKKLGFDGIELTVRPGGHVSPETAKASLPEAVETLRDLGVQVPVIATAITDADAACSIDVFEAAAASGVPEVKLGYWPYSQFGTFVARYEAVSRKLDGIEKLARRVGVRANIHTHSGDSMSASAFVVWSFIKDRDPAAFGAYVDPMHLSLEGGVSTWKMALDLLGERVTLVSIKDMEWRTVVPWVWEPYKPKQRWFPRIVPLDHGVVPWPEVFCCLRQIGFDGWISVHSEYQGTHSWHDMTGEEVIEQTRADLEYLRWASAHHEVGKL